jgi:nucleoside-diphosphate-sugar epimerase
VAYDKRTKPSDIRRTQTRDFTFVDDVVQANILAVRSEEMEFGIYNIGNGIETSFSRLMELINRHLGTNIQATYR